MAKTFWWLEVKKKLNKKQTWPNEPPYFEAKLWTLLQNTQPLTATLTTGKIMQMPKWKFAKENCNFFPPLKGCTFRLFSVILCHSFLCVALCCKSMRKSSIATFIYTYRKTKKTTSTFILKASSGRNRFPTGRSLRAKHCTSCLRCLPVFVNKMSSSSTSIAPSNWERVHHLWEVKTESSNPFLQNGKLPFDTVHATKWSIN